MTKGGSQHMVITVHTQNGKVISVVDENGNEATKVEPLELQEIEDNKGGFKHVGTVLHAHSSPGCVYFMIGGWWFKICR